MFVYLLFIIMYSPQPLSALQAGSFAKIAHRVIFKRSALQRGANKLLTPFFALAEKGEGGMSTWNV